MTFDTNRKAIIQEQFQIIELDTVSIAGACTHPSGSGQGFFTPLTCIQQSPQAVATFYFATPNTPIQFGNLRNFGDGSISITQPIYRVINNISENTTELKPSEGLAGRGTLSVSFSDFKGDPSSVNSTLDGTFFGKLNSRNILNNREVRVKYFHKKANGIYAATDALTKTYKVDSLINNGKGRWTLSAKDELTKTDKDKSQFPQPTDGNLRAAINNTVTAIPVDSQTTYAINNVIFIGGEFMRVTGVAGIGSGTASLTVAARGTSITGLVSGVLLTETLADSHSLGDTIQICRESDNERIDDLLEAILLSVDVDPAKLPLAAWAAEVDEWHTGVLINTLWFDPEDSNKVIKSILIAFLMDMWYEATVKEVKLSAISVWKQSVITLREGIEIDFETLRSIPDETMRFSRAYLFRDKPFLAESDDLQHFKALTVFKNLTLETSGLYGEPKTKAFEPNTLISKDSAQLLTQRFVSRFGFTPVVYTWRSQERFMDFATGDIVNILSDEVQDFDGLRKEVRAQVLSIKPRIGRFGREYDVKALTYEAAFANGSEFVLTGTNCEINLHILAGAPSQVVTLTFVFDGGIYCSQTPGVPSVIAGNFAAGSKLTIIEKNNCDWQGLGGQGGVGGNASEINSVSVTTDGVIGNAGGVCYDAEGVDTDIYLSGIIGAHTALGTLRAPGGGGAGSHGITELNGVDLDTYGGNGGGGGAGFDLGLGGGRGQSVPDEGAAIQGTAGDPGNNAGSGGLGKTSTDGVETTTSGAGGNFGLPGVIGTAKSGSTAGGLAGKGIVANGGIVCLFGAAVGTNFINGSGDAPCFGDIGPVITNISSGTPANVSVTITWTTDVPATSQIEYGLTSGYGSSTVKDGALVTSHSQTILSLTASTLYHFKVKSENASMVLTESVDQTFTTAAGADVTPPVISNIVNANINDVNVTVTWDTNEGATSQIEYGLTTAYGSFTTKDSSLVTSHSHTFSGLTASTLYHYRVISDDAATNTATSVDKSVTTAAGSSETVSYPGGNVTDFAFSPADAISAFIFSRDGWVRKILGTAQAVQWHTWVAPKHADVGVGYDVIVDQISGNALFAGTLGVWQTIISDRLYEMQETGTGTKTGLFRVRTRDTNTLVVLEDQNYTLTSTVEN